MTDISNLVVKLLKTNQEFFSNAVYNVVKGLTLALLAVVVTLFRNKKKVFGTQVKEL